MFKQGDYVHIVKGKSKSRTGIIENIVQDKAVVRYGKLSSYHTARVKLENLEKMSD